MRRRTAIVTAATAALLVTACSAAPEATNEGWREYLETARRLRSAGPPLAPGSTEERQAINRFQELLSDYKATDFASRTREVYAADAFFNDTLKTLRGAGEIERHLASTAAAIEEGKVEFLDVAAQDGDYYFRWLLRIRSKSLAGGAELLSGGMSHIRFDASGKVVLHQDFWDSSGGLFEHASGLGWLLRRAKRRL